VPVLFLIAIVVVLVGIFFAATGRGGEMSYEQADHAPLDLGPVSAADVALLRPPTAMWGYNMQVTDEALDQIARAMRERDVTIAYLQEQLSGYERDGSHAGPRGAYARQDREVPGPPEPPDALEPSGAVATAGALAATGALATTGALESPEDPESAQDPEAVQYPEELEPLIPGMHDPAEPPEPLTAEPPTAAAAAQAPGPPRTALILKASGLKPEPHEATQPSQILQDPEKAHDATEPTAVSRDGEEPGEATQPSATLVPDETLGPQGSFDTHGWWAQQKEAAREERAQAHVSGEQDDDSMAAAEEQGW